MKRTFALVLLICCAMILQAHTINFTLDEQNTPSGFGVFFIEGFKHIIPMGLDHILFIICIFFFRSDLRSVVVQASMFTVAHTITLGLCWMGILVPPAQIIEPLIAFSIVVLAIENIFGWQSEKSRLPIVFLFGLVHGMGFAAAISEVGIPQDNILHSLLGFNIGVEVGQLVILLGLYLTVTRTIGNAGWFRPRFVLPVMITVAAVAGFWTIERLL
jgi:hypothetical protein